MTHTLRVVFLGHSAAPSGAELGLVDLIDALEDVDPYVILAEDGPLVERLRARGVPVELAPLEARVRQLRRGDVRATAGIVPAGLAATAYSVRLGRRLRQLHADLVDAHTLKSFIYGCPAARLAATPLVWHVHDRVSSDYLPTAAIRMLRGVARHAASGVIANSEATLASLGSLDLPATIVHEPIPGDRFDRRTRRPGEPFTVVMVGRIAPWKGQDVFIEAFAAAFPRGPERARIVGSPLFGEVDFDRTLRRRIVAPDLAGRVELLGFREDVGAELARADALVHASVIPEPFGRVVVEGMAAGLPVIAASAGGPREIVTDGVDGLLYPPGDVAGLAAALRRVASEPELASRLGRAAEERAQAFAPGPAARRTSAFYRRLVRADGWAAA
jgi:glycosyltransferase involved in cell wall biosynthesis